MKKKAISYNVSNKQRKEMEVSMKKLLKKTYKIVAVAMVLAMILPMSTFACYLHYNL